MVDHSEDIGFLKAEMKYMKAEMKSVKETAERIEKELTKYKGFVGGMTFIWSCLVAAATMWFNFFGGKSHS